MEEIIYLQVKVKINYDKEEHRKGAIKAAKECVLSVRQGGGYTCCNSITAKLITKKH